MRHADIVVVAQGVTALGVEQRRTPGVAEPAGDRAELVVAAAGDQRAAREQHAIVVAAAEPAVLGFGAEHPVRVELVVEAALHAAHEADVAALQAVVARKGAADMAADIEAGPVVDHSRRGIGRSLGIGARRHVSRDRGSGKRDQSGCAEQKLLHDWFPVIVAIDINQTTWPQLGCFAAMPEPRSFLTVTARQQSLLVPAAIPVFCRKSPASQL